MPTSSTILLCIIISTKSHYKRVVYCLCEIVKLYDISVFVSIRVVLLSMKVPLLICPSSFFLLGPPLEGKPRQSGEQGMGAAVDWGRGRGGCADEREEAPSEEEHGDGGGGGGAAPVETPRERTEPTKGRCARPSRLLTVWGFWFGLIWLRWGSGFKSRMGPI